MAELRQMVTSHEYKTLTTKQRHAYDLMIKGENVFVTGPGGTGKTALIQMFYRHQKSFRNIAITSTTGTSAVLIGGHTLHSYLGIGLGLEPVEDIVDYLYTRPHIRKRWTETSVLVIDEISMLSPTLFDKIEEIGRVLRGSDEPFGGIQLVISGDFLQLPCVSSQAFCFQSKSWNKCISSVCYLDEIIRQSDPLFQKCLNNIRLGILTEEVMDTIETRVGAELKNDLGIQPTRLFALNRHVDQINEKELDALAEIGKEFISFDMKFWFSSHVHDKHAARDRFTKNCTAVPELQLCQGAQVILLINVDGDAQLANGSRGVIVGFNDGDDLPIVQFIHGEKRIIDYHQWEVKDKDKVLLTATQIPLKPAWAMSIHRAQGASLDYVEMDLFSIFENAMTYVALSRARNLEGLSITAIDWNKVYTHSDALEFYKSLD